MLDPNSRIAVLIRGVSYQRGHFARGSTPRHFFVNYDVSKDNIKYSIIDPLKNCDVFLSSYESEKQQDIIDFYKPKRYSFTPYNTGTQKTCLLRGFDMILEEHKINPYKAVVVIRFDVHFHKLITEYHINPDKFNFGWREIEQMWLEHRRTGDCFYAFNAEYTKIFSDTISNPTFFDNDLHRIYDPIAEKIGKHNIHFVEEDFFDSNTDRMPNPIYHINRLVG
jgi:hypothetical protein